MHIRLLLFTCLLCSLSILSAQPNFEATISPLNKGQYSKANDRTYFKSGIIYHNEYHNFHLIRGMSGNEITGYKVVICRRIQMQDDPSIQQICDTSFLISPILERKIFRTAVVNIMAKLHNESYTRFHPDSTEIDRFDFQLDDIYNEIKRKPITDELSDISEQYADVQSSDEYAGELTLAPKVKVIRQTKVGNSNTVVQLYDEIGAVSKKVKYGFIKRLFSPEDFYNLASDEIILDIQKASIKTDYNRLSDITITFNIEGDSTQLVLKNTAWSIPLNSLLVNTTLRQSLTFEYRGWEYTLFLDELLTFAPYRENFSYNVKNNSYFLLPGVAQKITRRSIKDFMGLIIFADPLGFTNNEANRLLQVEGTATIPINHRNTNRSYWFSQFHTAINFSLINGVDKELRFAPFREFTPTKIEIDNLDFVRFSNVNFKFLSSIYAREVKRLNTFLNFEAGIHMFRSSFRMTDSSDVKNMAVWAPTVNVNMTIRPDYAFGSNINVGMMWPRLLLGSSIDTPEPDLISNGMAMLFSEANFYAFTNPTQKKGGIFFRYVAYHDLHRRGFYPQVLIGYSTNLRGLIKNTVPK